MPSTKVLITVKTYPSISKKYKELVCTAGFTEAGEWIRIYPIQYRHLDYTNQYGKYDWIEIDLVRNIADFRKESFRPSSLELEPERLGHIDTGKNRDWLARKEIVLQHVETDLKKIVADARNPNLYTSLATFKPSEIVDFHWKGVARDWEQGKKDAMRQTNLFEQQGKNLTIIRKLPYKFVYSFKDENGKLSRMMVEDWEIGALYWNCLRAADGNEAIACQKVGEKYFDNFAKTKDLYFFLGTTKAHHLRARNPFVIIGTFHPPFAKVEAQLSLLDLFKENLLFK